MSVNSAQTRAVFLFLFLGALGVLLLSRVVPASGDHGNYVLVTSASGLPGSTIAVNVEIHNVPAPGLGSWQVEVEYPSNDLTVLGCTPDPYGVLSDAGCQPLFDAPPDPSIVRVSGFNLNAGATGDIVLARVLFRVNSGMTGCVALDLSVEEAVDLPLSTSTFTPTATGTYTLTPSATNTLTPTFTFTPTDTAILSTSTSTATPTQTSTTTSTPTSTSTATTTPTQTSTSTPTTTPTSTSTATTTPTQTSTSTATTTPTQTSTSTATTTPTQTATSITAGVSSANIQAGLSTPTAIATPSEIARVQGASGVALNGGASVVGYRPQNGQVCAIVPPTSDLSGVSGDPGYGPTGTLVPTTTFLSSATQAPAVILAPTQTPTPRPSGDVAGIRPPSTGDGGLLTSRDFFSVTALIVAAASGLGLVTSARPRKTD